MTETFTTTLNSTSNSLEMKEQNSIEAIGMDESIFYTSICADLDQIAMHPKADTVQNILNHSRSLR